MSVYRFGFLDACPLLLSFGPYYSYWLGGARNPAFDELSKQILDVKFGGIGRSAANMAAGVAWFRPLLHTLLADDDTVLCAIPRSDPALPSGVVQLVSRLAVGRRVDGSAWVCRRVLVGISRHARRTYERQRDSLSIASGVSVSGRRVWLLDDVVTTGCSIRAARDTLLDAGAVSVSVFVLGVTAPSPGVLLAYDVPEHVIVRPDWVRRSLDIVHSTNALSLGSY